MLPGPAAVLNIHQYFKIILSNLWLVMTVRLWGLSSLRLGLSVVVDWVDETPTSHTCLSPLTSTLNKDKWLRADASSHWNESPTPHKYTSICTYFLETSTLYSKKFWSENKDSTLAFAAWFENPNIVYFFEIAYVSNWFFH